MSEGRAPRKNSRGGSFLASPSSRGLPALLGEWGPHPSLPSLCCPCSSCGNTSLGFRARPTPALLCILAGYTHEDPISK